MDSLISRVAETLVKSNYAVALTGAGVSTESGIPDFRGPSGIWTKDPEAERRAYEAYGLFLRDPKRFWEELLSRPPLLANLEKASPNPSHFALAELENLGILKCIITQNIDGLHEKAGSKSIIEFHGSAFKLRCINCGARYPRSSFDLLALRDRGQLPPLCKSCGGILKPDVVYFTEPIPRDVIIQSLEEVRKCDVMLVCGTSLVVYPAAELPRIAKRKIPPAVIIEVNLDPTPITLEGISDYFLQGKTGEILPRIVHEVKARLRVQ
ncbi:MAG: NAD-dependent deacylase [Candidatus Nezhaarchaeota archaeon]|nr:NAD-dependent deacylase [Candidatus Nezhaarchaeota archaeon]MCX8141821.1 NAD-dependent deacylase [Candidatus Nezhaarchaeota archaeon]MDW8050398.1 NAD-dependent deacylase [Nitrososphaerota archaeon]